jgi:hypothetical protein
VIKLFQYLQVQLEENRVNQSHQISFEEFLKEQIVHSQEILKDIIEELKDTYLVSAVLDSFRVMGMIQLYMLNTMVEYERRFPEVYRNQFRDLEEFGLEVFRFLDDKKWTMNFEGGHTNTHFKHAWFVFLTLCRIAASCN